MNYNIEWKEKGVIVKLYDEVDDQLILYLNGLIIGNAAFEQINYQIWDCSEVSYYSINAYKGKEAAALDKAASIWNTQTKVAIVTENESLIDYTNEYIKAIAGTSWSCKIFSSLQPAEDWVLKA